MTRLCFFTSLPISTVFLIFLLAFIVLAIIFLLCTSKRPERVRRAPVELRLPRVQASNHFDMVKVLNAKAAAATSAEQEIAFAVAEEVMNNYFELLPRSPIAIIRVTFTPLPAEQTAYLFLAQRMLLRKGWRVTFELGSRPSVAYVRPCKPVSQNDL